MTRRSFPIRLLLVALASPLCASVFMGLDDPVDDGKWIAQATTRPAAKPSQEALGALKRMLLPWKERDFRALLGAPTSLPEKMAMPTAQPRGLGLPGLRYTDEKQNHDHVDTYAIGDLGFAQVYFGIDGESVTTAVFYLRPDADFIKAGPDEAATVQRLAWDQARLTAMQRWLTNRWRELYQYEVDAAAEGDLFSGDSSRDIKTKLTAWLETGRRKGWSLEDRPAANGRARHWSWFDKGTLVREAYPYGGDQLPNVFIWVHPGTNREMRREEGMGQGYLSWSRWCRPDGTNIRYETQEHRNEAAPWRADTWVWYDARGTECRVERDTNGDGLPDRRSDRLTAKQDEALPLAESWAVHPELIPQASRIGDQQRAVPIRKIPAP